MAEIRYEPISYPGTADIALDLTGELETDEVLTGTQTVTSNDVSVLTVGAGSINSTVLTKRNGKIIAIGKAVQVSVTSVSSATRDVMVYIDFAGDAGTTGTYTIIQPVQPKLP